jgi:sorting nexin-29
VSGRTTARCSLACLLFNIALEKIIRDAGIQTRGTIFYKSLQLSAYADDDIIGRSEHDRQKTFAALKTAVDAIGLSINQGKTKYMVSNCKN